LTEEESALLKELAVTYGSQKATIFEGLKLLKEKLNKVKRIVNQWCATLCHVFRVKT
jgi:hypothetical protein